MALLIRPVIRHWASPQELHVHFYVNLLFLHNMTIDFETVRCFQEVFNARLSIGRRFLYQVKMKLLRLQTHTTLQCVMKIADEEKVNIVQDMQTSDRSCFAWVVNVMRNLKKFFICTDCSIWCALKGVCTCSKCGEHSVHAHYWDQLTYFAIPKEYDCHYGNSRGKIFKDP